jgi:flagellar biosynthesis regulator FlaF
MHIFFCWSGTRSGAAAEALAGALAELEHFTVFLSPQIPKGGVWFERVTEELERADAGIVVLTPENARAPWLHFEAGALALGLRQGKRGRVYTYLFGLEPGEVGSPLSQYQHTLATEQDTVALVEQMLGRKTARKWQRGEWWLRLCGKLREAGAAAPRAAAPEIEALFRRKTFVEPIQECSDRAWIARYNGARDTENAIREAAPKVKSQCRQYAADIMEDLAQELNAYAMTIRANLMEEKRFELEKDGRLGIVPEGIAAACERRRKRILELQAALADEARAPVFEEAYRFEQMEFERKKDFIHRMTAELRAGRVERDWRAPRRARTEEEWAKARVSEWSLDRILFYVRHAAEGSGVGIERAVEWVWAEWEKVRAKGAASSRMALHYALDVLEGALVEAKWAVEEGKRPEFDELLSYLEELEHDKAESRIARRLVEWRRKMTNAA